MKEAQDSQPVSTRLQQIADLARQHPDWSFTNLSQHLKMDLLRAAYERVRKDGAVGIDGQTSDAFSLELDENLGRLLEEAKSGRYRAPPVKRVYIPKGDGNEKRALGMPTFADKVLQTAVTMLLTPLYEQDFLNCSYGYRPKRNAHQALRQIRDGVTYGARWIIEADIRKFFDNLGHEELRKILDRRVRDGVIRRLIDKWLNAGVMEGLELSRPESGTPQGGVISPLLSNIYLHEVLDVWFEKMVKPVMRGRAHLVRYADDFVMMFELERDARRVYDVLPKRFAKYGLALHPDKTRLLDFRPETALSPSQDNDGDGRGARTFNFLAFTHHWGRSRFGRVIVKQVTARDRFRRSLKRVREWCVANMHMPVGDLLRILGRKLRGYDGYFGITGNYTRVVRFHRLAERVLYAVLNRRSELGGFTWQRLQGLLARHPLPRASLPLSVYRTLRTRS